MVFAYVFQNNGRGLSDKLGVVFNVIASGASFLVCSIARAVYIYIYIYILLQVNENTPVKLKIIFAI